MGPATRQAEEGWKTAEGSACNRLIDRIPQLFQTWF
jgi:hypothetical protein